MKRRGLDFSEIEKQPKGAQTNASAHKANVRQNEIWIRGRRKKKRQENNNAKA